MKKLFVALTLALSLGSLAYAAEPAKAPAAAPGAPAASAPAAPALLLRLRSGSQLLLRRCRCSGPGCEERTEGQQDHHHHACSCIIIGITMGVVVWAAKQTKTAADFYAAGGGITGTQNGWAIAGDYMSAASFLGISGPDLPLRL